EEGKRRHGIFVRAWAARTGKENFQAADLPGSVPSGARAARAQRSSGVVARAGSQPGGNAPLRSLLRERGNLQRGAERTLDENSGAKNERCGCGIARNHCYRECGLHAAAKGRRQAEVRYQSRSKACDRAARRSLPMKKLPLFLLLLIA